MSRTLTAADRSALIRLASTMPVGTPERKAILKGLSKRAGLVGDQDSEFNMRSARPMTPRIGRRGRRG